MFITLTTRKKTTILTQLHLFNIFDDNEKVNAKTFMMGYTGTLYVSRENIYIAYQKTRLIDIGNRMMKTAFTRLLFHCCLLMSEAR